MIENILAVGKHFQSTSYFLENESVRELDPGICQRLLFDFKKIEMVTPERKDKGLIASLLQENFWDPHQGFF